MGETNLLDPKVPVLGYIGGLALAQDVPEGEGAKGEAKDGDGEDADIDEAGGEVIAEGAERTPTLLVAAKWLFEGIESAEVAVAELWDTNRRVAREGARGENALGAGEAMKRLHGCH